jgi:hypothetical protein
MPGLAWRKEKSPVMPRARKYAYGVVEAGDPDRGGPRRRRSTRACIDARSAEGPRREVEVADARTVKAVAPLVCKTDKVVARVLAWSAQARAGRHPQGGRVCGADRPALIDASCRLELSRLLSSVEGRQAARTLREPTGHR